MTATATSPARRRIRSYVRILFGLVSAALLLAAGLNLWVDPLRMVPTPLSSPAFEPYREMSSQIRTSKCGLIRSASAVDVALLGSSRVANGFDPLLAEWEGRQVYNLACPAGFIHESEALFRYLVRHHTPDLVVLGIDPGDLSSDLDTRALGDFASSPLGSGNFAVDREIRYLVGTSTLEASIETLRRRMSGDLPQYDERGMRRRPPALPMSQRAFLEESLRGETVFGNPEEGRRDEPLNAEKAGLLRGILRECRERGIRLVIFIHPQHALLHAGADREALLPFARERREITTLVAEENAVEAGGWRAVLWDFGDFHPVNCDPLPADEEGRMNYWADFEHFTPGVGARMLGRMLGWEGAEGDDYGMELVPESFDDWERRAREGYRRYVDGPGRADIEWKQRVSRGN